MSLIATNRRRYIASAAIAREFLRAFRRDRSLKSSGRYTAAGKRGKRQSCQSTEPTANEWNDSVGVAIIWRNDARRHLVVATAARFSRLIDFYRLFHVGRFSGGTLFFWQLYLALLFAGDFR